MTREQAFARAFLNVWMLNVWVESSTKYDPDVDFAAYERLVLMAEDLGAF